MGLLPCESIGTTPGIPFPGFVPSLSGGLLGHFLALTGPKYGAKRDLAQGFAPTAKLAFGYRSG